MSLLCFYRNFSTPLLFFGFPLLLILLTNALHLTCMQNFYIVFLGDHAVSRDIALDTHLNILSAVKGSSCLICVYLAATLKPKNPWYTATQRALMHLLLNCLRMKLICYLASMDEVVSVFPNQYRKLHTTRSWDFIGLPLTAKRKLKLESDIIVALLDTGVTPEFQSFKDDGFGPPPAKWKGTCDQYANFSGCNNKLIGAKYFKIGGKPDPRDILSPIDMIGHGTHTASTAAGNLVPNASLFGIAKGTARGAVPSARLAIYKVCWVSDACADMDILAAFEAAIHDGVDVISVSIGGGDANYVQDSIGIGAFHAMRKGIITVASAGNDGPFMATVTNAAPWIVTVAASGIDRDFQNTIELGSGKNVSGGGVSTFNPKQKQYPLVNGIDAARNSASKENAKFCLEDSLESNKVKGKLVYCKLGTWDSEAVVKAIGGIGTIFESDQFFEIAEIFTLPATIVNSSIGQIITNYSKSTRSPSAVIHKSHEVKISAPFTASFSSRGPNPGSQHILKPDVTAPGINILASYTPMKSITGQKGDAQFSEFTLMSGTSMSCPHVSGVAAYVKSFHPDWTPAAIRSAIITTAKPMSRRVNKDAEFAYGAGQVNPTRAVNPGLVYDMDDFAYIQFLCHEGYNGSTLSVLVGSPVNCTSLLPGLGHDAINYPSMQLSVENNTGTTVGVFRRRVTNVGPAPTIFNATIKSPKGVEITVKPSSLIFSHTLQKKSFKVVVKAKSMASMQIVSGSVIWRSPRYIVRSP
ncbi:Subtilisin-like protease SBT4.14, partial [Mucuna pruriens]